MPLAPNSLLQPSVTVAPKKAAGNLPQPAVEPSKSGAQDFSKVYAKASDSGVASVADKASKPARDKAPEPAAGRDAGDDKVGDKQTQVADSGKPLPGGKDKVSADQDDSTDKPVDDSPVTLDPAALVPVAPIVTAPPVAETPPEVVVPQPVDQLPPLAVQANVAAAQAQPVVDDNFDPQADPLDDMPAVRLAMEQGGHVSASSQAPVKNAPTEAQPTAAQGQANGIAMLLDQKADTETSGEGGEKSFKGLVDDGLKDLKSASSDTRVDDFANRLAALTQAAVPKTANALPVNQPLAMHQSGWSEEVVNRVMYLSSANLKSADIQLEPAELGRLDIRVNMTVDQPAQVNFVSGHAGVREALEGQMHRLREMFAQQGMGQVDVNVSDQSRNWQGQGQDQQGQNAGRTRGGGRLDGSAEDDLSVAAAQAEAPSVVLGSSAVDYYA